VQGNTKLKIGGVKKAPAGGDKGLLGNLDNVTFDDETL